MSTVLSTDPIADDELLIRRVPPGETGQKPGPVPTSDNVELRQDETGLSASRAAITTPKALLDQIGASQDQGWLVIQARVGDLRAIGLHIVSKQTDVDPGHVEIELVGVDLSRRAVRRALIKLFSVVHPDEPSKPVGS
jgi:hypothetical protein